MSGKTLTLLAGGDMILRMPEAESMFAFVAPVLKSSDVVVGQGEMPFTARSAVTAARSYVAEPDGRPKGCDPKNMSALKSAGFNVIHLAGNHIWDAGIPGIEDTVNGLRDLGIATVGAGMDIDEARKPAIIERKGTKFGFLSYNCVGPHETWANPIKPGCAYVYIITHYELDHPTPGGTPTVYTFVEQESLKQMVVDIRNLRPHCDVLVIHFHKGIGAIPVKIAAAERDVSYAAIDAGADLILAEHAHILKGIEEYKGKIIFHGLGNFIGDSPKVKKPERPEAVVRQEQRRRKEWFGLTTDPNGLKWQGDSRYTIIAKCVINDGKISRTGFLPCLINNLGQPEILKHDERGQVIFDYMDKITREAGLNARFIWDGDEAVIHQE